MVEYPWDRLKPGWPGLENLPDVPGVTPQQVLTFGTDIWGNKPTIGQFAAAGKNPSEKVTDIYTKAVSEGSIIPLTGGVGETAEGGSWIEQLLQRGAVLILGFIFVAIGLSMFARGGSVMAAATAPVRKAAGTADQGLKAAAANTA